METIPSYTFQPIGIIHSCFKEKFGIPVQTGLATEARATLELLPPYDREEAIRGLSDFSHLWIVFIFHGHGTNTRKFTVRPPRLGGKKRVGVFASRSSFRPNPIGLSVVSLKEIQREKGRVGLMLKGGDFLDQTPVIDIKPYIPYADALPDANGGFASEPPQAEMEVFFEAPAREALDAIQIPGLASLIGQMLRSDPRPAHYKKVAKKEYKIRVYDYTVVWEIRSTAIRVTRIRLSEGDSAVGVIPAAFYPG